MQPRIEQPGSRKVEPHKRKRKSTPSDRARAARRLVARIEATGQERRQAWADDGTANTTERLAHDLDALHADKRKMRRAVYRERPELEGRPVHRGLPSGGRS